MGTEIYEIENSHKNLLGLMDKENPEKLKKVADLDEEGSIFLAAKGGKGSVGNFRNKKIRDPIKG